MAASTAKQVSGTDMALMDAIRKGDIEKPPLCKYSSGDDSWLRWRGGAGRRPNASADGAATSQGLESHLWRTAMFEFHGEDWETQLKASADDQAGGPETKGTDSLQLVDPLAPRATDLGAASLPLAHAALGSPGSVSRKSGSPRPSQMSPR